MRDVAVLAMLEDDAECACVSRGFGVGDCECDGVRGARAAGMGMRPFGCGRRGVAVWVDEEDAEESDFWDGMLRVTWRRVASRGWG